MLICGVWEEGWVGCILKNVPVYLGWSEGSGADYNVTFYWGWVCEVMNAYNPVVATHISKFNSYHNHRTGCASYVWPFWVHYHCVQYILQAGCRAQSVLCYFGGYFWVWNEVITNLKKCIKLTVYKNLNFGTFTLHLWFVEVVHLFFACRSGPLYLSCLWQTFQLTFCYPYFTSLLVARLLCEDFCISMTKELPIHHDPVSTFYCRLDLKCCPHCLWYTSDSRRFWHA